MRKTQHKPRTSRGQKKDLRRTAPTKSTTLPLFSLINYLKLDFFHRFDFSSVDPNWLNVTANFGPSAVRHLAWDTYIPGNVLIIFENAWATVNFTTNATSVIAGNPSVAGSLRIQRPGTDARFHTPFSFFQKNSTHVILIDSLNHCLLLVSRETNTTTILAGKPATPGQRIGAFSES